MEFLSTLTTIDYISIIGTLATIIGLGIAIFQINKVQSNIKATKEAIILTEEKIRNNYFNLDISKLTVEVDLIKEYIRSEKYELAGVFTNNLKSNLVKLKHIEKLETKTTTKISSRLNKLIEYERLVEKAISLGQMTDDIKNEYLNFLSSLSLELNEIIGKKMFNIK